MFEKRALFLLFLVSIFLFFGCNDYRKVLKSSDLEYKYTRAIQYYEEGDYYRALPLIEELHAIYRGTSKSEQLAYYQAFCDFNLGDYYSAGYRFTQFTRTYPASVHAEECLFMSAYCHYVSSPTSSLDQTDTQVAIDKFQLFVNRFPASRLVDSSNTLVDQLRDKLETKSVRKGMLYFKTGNYKAAIIALENTLTDFPDTDEREQVQFTILKASQLLALNSVESKKNERLDEVVKTYRKFVDQYPESRKLKEAESIYSNVVREKKKLTENKNL